MTLQDLLFTGETINDETTIKVFDASGEFLAKGFWFNDNLLSVVEDEILEYTVNTQKNSVIVKLL